MRTTQIIEALLFASDAPLAAADLARVDEELDEDRVVDAIEELRLQYEESARAFQVYEVGGGFQLLTRPEYAPHLELFDTVPQPSRLSTPALEVLAIIAYRQPIGRSEIEEIRGVGSSAVLRTLQDRGLVEVVARGEGLGRPLLYGVTRLFLEHFGFRSVEDLPRPDELPIVLRERRPDSQREDAPDAAATDAAETTREESAAGEAAGHDGGEAGRPTSVVASAPAVEPSESDPGSEGAE